MAARELAQSRADLPLRFDAPDGVGFEIVPPVKSMGVVCPDPATLNTTGAAHKSANRRVTAEEAVSLASRRFSRW
jgi:hypothetical protein